MRQDPFRNRQVLRHAVVVNMSKLHHQLKTIRKTCAILERAQRDAEALDRSDDANRLLQDILDAVDPKDLLISIDLIYSDYCESLNRATQVDREFSYESK